MAFPASLPSYTITAGAETANGAAGGLGLSGLLNAFEVDITALGTKMGTGSSTPTSGKVLRASGTGTSAWAAADLTTDVTGTLPVANGGTGSTSASTGSGGVVLANSPTIVTPTIASFANAQHNHSNAAGGGILADSSITPAMLFAGTGTTWPWTTYAPAATGYSGTPTVLVARYIQMGKTVILDYDVIGTSNATTATFTLPVAAKSAAIGFTRATDSGSAQTLPGIIVCSAASTTATLYKTAAAAAWTGSGSKEISIYGFVYEAN